MQSEALRATRYLPLSQRYRERFGCKVYKVPVSVAQTCPNRQGLHGMKVCTFCDPWGSAAYPELAAQPVGEQVRQTRERLRQRYKAQRFLAYFQAYTNTFDRVATLEARFAEALAQQDVVGLVVGTRPDCLPADMLALLERLARETHVAVELGVQSFDDAQLAFLSRGHSGEASVAALRTLRAIPGLDVSAHLMFGLPGETPRQLQETARLLNAAAVDGVKLHNLHVLKRTRLARQYAQGDFVPVTLPAYTDKVIAFLEHLAPTVAIHRLNAVASRWDEVVAPAWAREKLGPTQAILDEMARRDTWQGRLYEPPPPLPPQGVGTGTAPHFFLG